MKTFGDYLDEHAKANNYNPHDWHINIPVDFKLMHDGMEEAIPPRCEHTYTDEDGLVYCTQCGDPYVN